VTDPLDLLKRRKPRVRRLAVLTDDDLADELDVAQEALVAAEGRAQGHEGDEAAQDAYRAAQAEVERLEAAVDAATVVFRFTGLPRNDWEELMEAHPATPAQVEQATKAGMFFGLDFNPDTFQPAAVAACAVI
jgi:multidrug efflux pump subunit AcrA (membrane-fusion protein)